MPVFDKSLIPQSAHIDLKPGYDVRPMDISDYSTGVLEVLAVLTTVGTVTQADFQALLEHWAAQTGTYFPIVISDSSAKVVACGTLVVERKIIHSGGLVGHIEDIAVARDQQGLKLGKRLIDTLSGIAKAVGCYKVILDCDEKNVGFYEKCDYKRAGVEMETRF